MKDYFKHLITADLNIKEALRKLIEVPKNLTLFVIDDENRMVGTITDGDIRRGLLKGLNLDSPVSSFMSLKFHFIRDNEIIPSHISVVKKAGIKLLPVLDNSNHIKRVIDLTEIKTLLPVTAVLMAGGRGERLRPLTDNIPKPLLIVGNKPIIEHLISHLRFFGISDYYVVIKYLGEQIENYLGDGKDRELNIKYIKEKEAMGTMGSVSMINDFKHNHILVINSDIFTNINLEDLYQTMLEENADLAIATIPYTVDIPFAVLDLNNDRVIGLQEKPKYTFHSNAGIYLVNKELFKLIPVEKYFNATDFIQLAVEAQFKVIRFPIIGYWIDIGRHEDYQKVQEIAKHIKNG